MEELRHRVHEVGDLRQEEEQHRLAEVAQDADDCERHAGEVAIGVADKRLRWIPGAKLQSVLAHVETGQSSKRQNNDRTHKRMKSI